MIVVIDNFNGDHFVEIVLNESECEGILEGALFSVEREILGRTFYIGVRLLRDEEEFEEQF